jgi:hypothetical protein
MRGALKYGVPATAALATGGYALSQGEDPGSALLAGLAGGTGAAGGLLASRKLAGKYADAILGSAKTAGKDLSEASLEQAAKMREGGLRQKALLDLAEAASGVQVAPDNMQRAVGRSLAASLVPGSAALAGLGGVAAGAIPGAMGIPGFQQGGLDPESYGSSNSPGARYKASTMQYM